MDSGRAGWWRRTLSRPMNTTRSSPAILGRLKSRSARMSRPASGAISRFFSARRKVPATLSTEPIARRPQS